MRKNTIILAIGIIISKMFGMLREVTLGRFYGTGPIAEAYIVASNIPNVIFGFVAAGIVTTFIPVFSKILTNEGEEEANKFFSNVLNIMAMASVILAIFGFIFAEELVLIFASGFKPETKAIAGGFVRISVLSVVFLSTKSLLEGYLQIKKRFLATVMSGLLMNTIVISSIFLSGIAKQPKIMAIGILISIFAQLLLVMGISYRAGYAHTKKVDPKDKNFISMLTMAAPIILGSSVDQINKVLDTNIATFVAEGALSSLNYAVRISDSILGIFVTSISSVLYPSLAAQAAKGEIEELKVTVRKTMNTINILIIPATFGLMILAQQIISILYPKFNEVEFNMTSSALIFYTVGTVGYGLRQILVRTFYSLHDSKTPVIVGIFSVLINLSLNILLAIVLDFGVAGLALATSVSALTSVVILYYLLTKKIGSLGTKAFLTTTAKITFSALVMAVLVFTIYNQIGGITGMGLSIIVGMLAYTVVVYFMKIDEADEIFNLIKKKLKLI